MPEGRPNAGYAYRSRVAANHRGTSLLDYLAERYPHSTREAWSRRIEQGQVRVEGRRVGHAYELRQGERLVWQRPPWIEPDAPLRHAVLHRDADLLVVAKPAGLPTLPGAGFLEHTLLHRVRLERPDAVPLHRLGRWTSGLVLFALSHRAREGVASQLRACRVLKRYRALASGRPRKPRFECDVPIGPVPYARLGTIHAASSAGRPARSRIEVLEDRQGGFLADVVPVTGRPHQIRIHMAAAGHPLMGDPLYRVGGLPAVEGDALPGDPGYHLHAAELRLDHPGTGRRVAWRCVAPPRLRRHGAGDPDADLGRRSP